MTPLTEPPVAGNELDSLLGGLERGRRLVECKSAGHADLIREAIDRLVGEDAPR